MSNPIDGRLADLDERLFMPRELSWLSFNARVLQEAENETFPLSSGFAISASSRVILTSFSESASPKFVV